MKKQSKKPQSTTQALEPTFYAPMVIKPKVLTLDERLSIVDDLVNQINDLDDVTKEMFMNMINPKAKTSKPLETKEKVVNKGVGKMACDLIKRGYTNTMVLKLICEHYGNTQTTYACVAWYRNDMKSKGLL